MLKLKSIIKDYDMGDMQVNALRGIDLCFRKSEFVSILGPSGCGKTTLLNIIGGLDRYTSGDLVINGKSTKEYNDREWDSYRNHKIGFVFQTYNLIPHQTVLSNVELALTLSGVSKQERKKRAKDALTKVGLGDQFNKKPNQMSGGQQQRVAIARALVNNPDIILADEPTGALDTETSVQIMEILKEISKEKLIIMVTHNPDLAETYSNRIVRMVDGKLFRDSNPYTEEEYEKDFKNEVKPSKDKKKEKQGHGKVSMSFFTALGLSTNNLMTKKGRSILTSFAGSIGIIGIALILALSSGIKGYIDTVQRDTLSSYPVQITQQTMDLSSFLTAMAPIAGGEERDPDKVYSNTMMLKLISVISSEIKSNNLVEFKKYLESGVFDEYINAISYGYTANMQIYSYKNWQAITDAPQKNQLVYPSTVVSDMMQIMGGSVSGEMSSMATTMYNMEPWCEMLSGRNGEIVNPMIKDQYELLGDNSRFPENYNEIVIVLTKDNQISDLSLYSMGIKDKESMEKLFNDLMEGKVDEEHMEEMVFSYDDLLGLRFKLVLPTERFEDEDNDGIWSEKSDVDALIENGIELKVVGVIRPKEDTVSASINGTLGYTAALTEYVIKQCVKSDILKAQLANPEVDVFTGKNFEMKVYNKQNTLELLNDMSEEMAAFFISQMNEMIKQQNPETSISTKEEAAVIMSQFMSDEDIAKLAEQMIGEAKGSYNSNLANLGYCDMEKPSSISIYASTFENKEEIERLIEEYNKKAEEDEKEENVIRYTDYVAIMMSSFTSIIDFVTYGLIAFVSVSLVVSSIMIGIITYISVLERTKEIGVLRAIGASKKDVKRVFNAETIIMGFLAGSMGIIATLLISIPVNVIFEYFTDISSICALPWQGALILIALSIFLTFIAGLIPASAAAKKDPVTALRTE